MRIAIIVVVVLVILSCEWAEGKGQVEFEFIKELKNTGGKNVSFGKEMESEFFFEEGLTFLNHGSFGATPRSILYQEFDYQIAMERDTMRWMNHKRIPLLNQTRTKVANYIGADPEDVVMVLDATSGINAVFRSLQFSPGEKILYLDTAYGAVQEMFKVISYVNNVELIKVEIPIPLTSADQIVDLVEQALKDHSPIRIALFSHITSPTALILPVEELTSLCHLFGTEVFIDGAHAMGQIPLNVVQINADYYTSDLHKWMCSPKGSAFLWVRRDHQHQILPTSISSGASGGYLSAFEWTGTLDFSAYFCAMASIDWRASIGGDEAIMSYNNQLAAWAAQYLADLWKTSYPIAPVDMFASLTVVPVPSGPTRLTQDLLYDDYMIECVVFNWDGVDYVRLSAHIYNYKEQYMKLGDAVLEIVNRPA